MISIANLNCVAPVNDIPSCHRDPFLETWLFENGNIVGKDNQTQMHSFNQSFNNHTASQFDKVDPDVLMKYNLCGYNGLASLDSMPILHGSNIPLPYIPETLLESLSESIFAIKSATIPVKLKSPITKKINSHSKKEHQV